MAELETDYLVIGAGATSITFIDEVISNTEDVKIIGINKLPSSASTSTSTQLRAEIALISTSPATHHHHRNSSENTTEEA